MELKAGDWIVYNYSAAHVTDFYVLGRVIKQTAKRVQVEHYRWGEPKPDGCDRHKVLAKVPAPADPHALQRQLVALSATRNAAVSLAEAAYKEAVLALGVPSPA